MDSTVSVALRVVLVTVLAMCGQEATAADWPQWGGTAARNMASNERGLPDGFEPGRKDPQGGGIDLKTTRNVKWVVHTGEGTCSTPVVAEGKVYIGTVRNGAGVLMCLSESTGRLLWQWEAPVRRDVPKEIDGRKLWFNVFPQQMGVSGTPQVVGDRVYLVNHRCEVMCMAADGDTSAASDRRARVLWTFDLWKELGTRPSDVYHGSVLVDGELIYVCTSNGVDRDAIAAKQDERRKPPSPWAPNIVALDKRTGRLVASDRLSIAPNLLHGQWGSPSLGQVNDRRLLFYGAGDGVCYAFEALASPTEKPMTLKTAWLYDCNPPEYKQFGGLDLMTHYCRGDVRRSDTLIKSNDGTFVGMSEIIATPVFYRNRVYVAIGRDPAHGRGRGALHCIDATRTGDITASGKIWSYQGLDRSISTVALADGLVYASDVAGRLHCLDAETGKCYWIHEGDRCWAVGSPLVADGKVFMPTDKSLWVLEAGKQRKVLNRIRLGSAMWATPVAANGTLYIASKNYLWAVGK